MARPGHGERIRPSERVTPWALSREVTGPGWNSRAVWPAGSQALAPGHSTFSGKWNYLVIKNRTAAVR